MRKYILVVITAILILALATVAMAADPFVGTWKLNLAKSKFPAGQALKSGMLKKDGIDSGIKSSFEGVDAQGKAFHTEWLGRYDDKDYAVKGDPTMDTAAMKKIDTNTVVEVDKKAGKEVGRYRSTVSKDGKTLNATGEIMDPKGQAYEITYVFDKQ